MKNNLPQERKDNIFTRFISKIKNLLFKSKSNNETIVNNNEIKNNETPKTNITNDMLKEHQVSSIDERGQHIRNERKKFLQMLSDKPELLEHFSNDKLEIILKEYQHSNEIKRMKIKRYGGSV